MVTLTDIALRAGVSASTVSNVLNRRGSYTDETRAKILHVAHQLGYQRRVQGSRTWRTSTILTVYSPLRESYPAEDIPLNFEADVITAIERKVREQGYRLVITGAGGAEGDP